jgi:histidinol-phosphate aminotransferase
MIGNNRPPELYAGLRLHQNENTGGCSPRVLEALSRLRPDQIALYPPYAPVVAACAKHVGVDPDTVVLVNGLEEGILALAVAGLRPLHGGLVPEVIIPQPAFEVFGFYAATVGARVVEVMPGEDFAFPLDDVLAAISARTRLVILTNPNNPTGIPVPLAAIRRISSDLPPGALVFVDEAYIDFGGDSFVRELSTHPNVIVGRTYSKAYGLAGLRIGLLTGNVAALDPIRCVVPAYSINFAATVAVLAALDDRAYTDNYLRQTAESKQSLYRACERWRLRYWPSAANFVLVRTGDHTTRVLRGVLDGHIYLRDRSDAPGCAGCIRITTGIVEHTRRVIAAIEEVLCAAA